MLWLEPTAAVHYRVAEYWTGFIAWEVALGNTAQARGLYKRCHSRAMDVEGAQLGLCQARQPATAIWRDPHVVVTVHEAALWLHTQHAIRTLGRLGTGRLSSYQQHLMPWLSHSMCQHTAPCSRHGLVWQMQVTLCMI